MWKFLCRFFAFPGVPFSKLCKNCSVVSCYRRHVPNEDNEYFDKEDIRTMEWEPTKKIDFTVEDLGPAEHLRSSSL